MFDLSSRFTPDGELERCVDSLIAGSEYSLEVLVEDVILNVDCDVSAKSIVVISYSDCGVGIC